MLRKLGFYFIHLTFTYQNHPNHPFFPFYLLSIELWISVFQIFVPIRTAKMWFCTLKNIIVGFGLMAMTTVLPYFDWLIDWYVCCLLADPELWKGMLLKCSITMVFTCPLFSWCQISSLIRKNNNVLFLQFPFHISMPLAELWFIQIQGKFSS